MANKLTVNEFKSISNSIDKSCLDNQLSMQYYETQKMKTYRKRTSPFGVAVGLTLLAPLVFFASVAHSARCDSYSKDRGEELLCEVDVALRAYKAKEPQGVNYTTRVDYNQVMAWAKEMAKWGAIKLRSGTPIEKDLVDVMAQHEFNGSQCTAPYYFQILYTYRRDLYTYFLQPKTKEKAVKKIISILTNQADLDTDDWWDPEKFAKAQTDDDKKWQSLLNGAIRFNQIYCKEFPTVPIPVGRN